MKSMFKEEALKTIHQYLLRNEETIAVAESVTSGFLQAAFSNVPDASKFFQGGITAYNLGQKCRHLNVNPIHAEDCNCVSQKVATEMALHVCPLLCSHWGIGITGYATKVPEGNNDLVAYYALAYNNKIVTVDRIDATTKEGEETQLYFVNEVLLALQKHLKKSGKGKE
jgi:PncC family amidohydrolase